MKEKCTLFSLYRFVSITPCEDKYSRSMTVKYFEIVSPRSFPKQIAIHIPESSVYVWLDSLNCITNVTNITN